WMLAWIELRENVGGRASELERGLGRNRLHVRHPANAVGPENLFCLRHGAYCSGGLRPPTTFYPSPRSAVIDRRYRPDSPAAFISLILRCKVRRLMPSFCAAFVMFPFVVDNACMIKRLSVSCRSSALDFSPNAFAGVMPP